MGADVPLTQKYQSELMEPSVTGGALGTTAGRYTGQVGHLLLPCTSLSPGAGGLGHGETRALGTSEVIALLSVKSGL